MSSQDSGGVGVGLAEHAGGKPGSIACEGESSDPAEEVNVCSWLIHSKDTDTQRGRKKHGVDALRALGGLSSRPLRAG